MTITSHSFNSDTLYNSSLLYDTSLLEHLYFQLRPMAIHFARQVPSLYDADDMLQFAVMAIIEHLQSTSNDVPYSVIRAIASRTMARKCRVQRTLSLNEPMPFSGEEWIDNLADKSSSPPPVSSLAQRRKVFKLLSCLGPKRRNVVMARFGIEDHRHSCKSVDQVCRKYQMSVQQFRNSCNQALFVLRKQK